MYSVGYPTLFGRVCILPSTGSDQLVKTELLSQMCFIGILEAAGVETAQNYFQIRITIGKAKRDSERILGAFVS